MGQNWCWSFLLDVPANLILGHFRPPGCSLLLVARTRRNHFLTFMSTRHNRFFVSVRLCFLFSFVLSYFCHYLLVFHCFVKFLIVFVRFASCFVVLCVWLSLLAAPPRNEGVGSTSGVPVDVPPTLPVEGLGWMSLACLLGSGEARRPA